MPDQLTTHGIEITPSGTAVPSEHGPALWLRRGSPTPPDMVLSLMDDSGAYRELARIAWADWLKVRVDLLAAVANQLQAEQAAAWETRQG